jgi:Ca2+-binding EF-hand superfamily protein
MNTRHIALAFALVLPVATITACDSQSESGRLSDARPFTEQQSTPDRQAPVILAQLDKDQDGVVSRSEAADSIEIDERFGELDKNKDGQLSRSELDQASALPR